MLEGSDDESNIKYHFNKQAMHIYAIAFRFANKLLNLL